jgi:fagellar hook-basal body proteins
MSFGQGLSGLKAAAQKLDVIGNNIANSGTVGFKSSSVAFADVYASSRVGLGVQISSVNQDFSVGNLTVTGGQFDMAIDGASGLFRVIDESGSVYFTRNGQFSQDKNGYIVNAQGQYLTGYILDRETGAYSMAPEAIRVPTGNIAPRATGTVDGVTVRAMNLDATAEAPAAAVPFPSLNGDVVNPNSYNMSVPLTVYDSLGREHQLTQYFRKTGTNTWEVYYQLGDKPPADPTDPASWQRQTITFQSNGTIQTVPAPTYQIPFTVGGADPLNIPVSYVGATQFGGPFNYEFRQDGYATGEYASMTVAADGTIMANYTNGELLEVGYVVLADFPNVQGLSPSGGNAWTQTAESGAPRLGRPGLNGLASIMSQAVEESNVDISTQLVDMIISQRTYQANAQAITTQSEMMQTLMNIR